MFGLLVLAGEGEHTAVGIRCTFGRALQCDWGTNMTVGSRIRVLPERYQPPNPGISLPAQQVFVDRTNSSADGTDADVRAGPMPQLETAGVLNLHAYADLGAEWDWYLQGKLNTELPLRPHQTVLGTLITRL